MSDIQSWDSGGSWDSGLQYDVNNFPSTGDVKPYLDLVPSENRGKSNFIDALTQLLQPLVDNSVTLESILLSFDIDSAVGNQLDIIGQWVGRTRYLKTPLSNVYFSLGSSSLGFGQGVWKGPFDPSSGLLALPDYVYRTYLKAIILSNQWDGTIPSAYKIWDALFSGTGFTMFIVDNGDMTMYMGLIGGQIDAVTLALLTGGYLDLRPGGVEVVGYITSSIPSTPIFGFGLNTSSIGGFGVGSWASILPPT
jgi:hypothetical protein